MGAIGALAILFVLHSSLAAAAKTFSIAEGPASDSLKQFSIQAGVSLFFDPILVGDHRTRKLVGTWDTDRALERLLAGTGLEAVFLGAKGISVRPEQSAVQSRPSEGPKSKELPVVHIPGWRSPSHSELPAGTLLRRVTAEDLARVGFSTLAEWARSLTQNQGSGATEDTRNYLREALTNTAYGTGLNFYGLGSRATLILVNGRRVAPSGSAGAFTDIASIPIAAIDHIDVISDGSAALYGTDALGGIVNFVLRGGSAAQVPDAVVTQVAAGSQGEKELNQSFCGSWDQGGGALSLNYYRRNALAASSRSQATSNLTPWGGSSFDTFAGNPGTIIDSEGRLWGIPSGQTGVGLTRSELLPVPNSYDQQAGTQILPHQERLSLLGSLHYSVSDSSTVYLNALVNRRRINIRDAPLMTALSVPYTNPFYVNPIKDNQDPLTVLYGFGQDLGPITVQGQVDSGQFALGFDHDLSRNWKLRSYAGYTYENQKAVEHGLVNFGVLQNFLNSVDATTAFNAFGAGPNTNNSTTLAAIRADGTLNYDSAFSYVDFSAVGSVPFLPAGPITLTLGSDYRVQSLRTTLSPSLSSANLVPSPATDRDRTVGALYAVSSTPILSPDLSSGWPLKLDLSAGVRYEHLSDQGQVITPTLGFEFQPAPSVTIQGSWARLFRPPNLPDLNEAPNISEVFVLPDPKSPTGYTSALVWTGNNASLRSETAHSWTLDVSFAPVSVPNFTASATYFNILSSNRVPPQQPLSPTVFSDPQYSYLVNRTVSAAERADVCSHSQFLGTTSECLNSAVGAIIDLRLRNVETLKTDGFDLTSRYGLDTPLGVLSVNVTATYMLHYEVAATPNAPLVEYRSTDHNPPALRLRSLFTWEHQGWSVSPALNFQSRYTDIDSIPQRPVDSWTTWDLVMAYTLKPFESKWGGETTLSLRSQNIFNKQPPFLNNSVDAIGYDPENGDLLGRRVSLSILHRW